MRQCFSVLLRQYTFQSILEETELTISMKMDIPLTIKPFREELDRASNWTTVTEIRLLSDDEFSNFANDHLNYSSEVEITKKLVLSYKDPVRNDPEETTETDTDTETDTETDWIETDTTETTATIAGTMSNPTDIICDAFKINFNDREFSAERCAMRLHSLVKEISWLSINPNGEIWKRLDIYNRRAEQYNKLRF